MRVKVDLVLIYEVSSEDDGSREIACYQKLVLERFLANFHLDFCYTINFDLRTI